jgi:hypothetical protein
MPDKKLSQEELERQRAEQLPDREVMTALNPVIHPVPPVPTDDVFPHEPGPRGSIGGTP